MIKREMSESERITIDAENLFKSAKKVRDSSPAKYSTQKFMSNILQEINRAQEELTSRTWQIENMKPFLISERGHIRKIQGNTPYDRMIIHSYIDGYLEPKLKPYLIYDNYASQTGKGTELARKRFKKFLSDAHREYHTNQFYVLLIDFRKFYDNINHGRLYDEIMNYIPGSEFDSYMLRTILDSFKVDVSWMSEEEYKHCYDSVYVALDHLTEEAKSEKFMRKSLNIGNQASQLFSIFYPTRIDNYCKIVRQCKYYGRYMDDISIIHGDKRFLWSVLEGIKPICKDLKLFLNEKKTQLYRVDHDFKWLNRIYRVTPTGHIIERLAPDTIYREERRLKAQKKFGKSTEAEEQFRSWIGSFGHHMTQWEIDKIYRLRDEVINAECEGTQPEGC